MDAANIDLKGFSEAFYGKVCGGELGAVLETLEYVHRETRTWLEITTLLIPGYNDSESELEAMCAWLAEHLGLHVPLHFTAFHPDWKMLEVAPRLQRCAARGTSRCATVCAMSTPGTCVIRREAAPGATAAARNSSDEWGTTSITMV